MSFDGDISVKHNTDENIRENENCSMDRKWYNGCSEYNIKLSDLNVNYFSSSLYVGGVIHRRPWQQRS